jgi:hypothetical protein
MSRHIFRLTYYKNIEIFLKDGCEFAKNHQSRRKCYRTSYAGIVDRRGQDFFTPDQDNINDYVPFYFSPITAMACAIDYGNVHLTGLNGKNLGIADYSEIVFMVSNTDICFDAKLKYWYTDIACNSGVTPKYENDLSNLEGHVDWKLFDEDPKTAHINEIGYDGVTNRFNDLDKPGYKNRKKIRMAEFMVKDFFPLNLVQCIITKNDEVKHQIEAWIQEHEQRIPVFTKLGCYF